MMGIFDDILGTSSIKRKLRPKKVVVSAKHKAGGVMMFKYHSQVHKFWKLHADRKSAALDVNEKSGEMICRFSKSSAGVEGAGAPGEVYGDDWTRIIICLKGEIRKP